MQIVKSNIATNDLESEYITDTSVIHRKSFAQFFTPLPIAELMVKWLIGNPNLVNVLEPAFGLGIFSRILLQYKNNIKIEGFEIDNTIFQNAKNYFDGINNVRLHLEDYMYNDWDNKYDGIICNPPYFKFHDYDNKGVLKEIEKRISCKLNGLTNLYTLFLIKSISQLKRDGRAAYIIPSEFMNSDYGKLIKSYLLKSKTLRHIIVIDFEENVFPETLTTASILLLANDCNENVVHFTNVKSVKKLHQIVNLIEQYPCSKGEKEFIISDLDPHKKWRAYYQEQNARRYKYLVPFTNYGKVVRGIATGCNKYFTFNLSKAQEYGIDQKNLLPCICRSVDIKGSFFTMNDFEALKKNDKSVFLLNAFPSNDSSLTKYLEMGVREQIHKKYLTANRSPWYILENRPPSPIWISVFNRSGLRIIRNEANISNLTTFHCVYLNHDLFSISKADLLFAYLLTDVSKKIFEDNRREYANGLQKFEPNDINNAKMFDLEYLDSSTEEKILEYYYLYRESAINKIPNVNFIKQINDIFIEKFT